METHKKMERKLIHITLPRIKDKPNTSGRQRDEGPLIKLRDS